MPALRDDDQPGGGPRGDVLLSLVPALIGGARRAIAIRGC
jgi:hypothetical protein